MKKLVSLIVAFLLSCSFIATSEEALFTGYESNFKKGFDGWYARSTGSASLETNGTYLKITGRDSSWNSPGRDFNLMPGTKYRFSFNVKQNDADQAELMVSVAHSKNGIESYENLAKASCKRGVWTTISGEYTPNAYDNYILYVETVAHPDISFLIKDISVMPANTVYDVSLVSLKELYAPYFDLGCALNNSQVYNANLMNFVSGQFNIITHENEFKPDSCIDLPESRKLADQDETAVALKFTQAKPILDYCQKNGIKLHGHVLVWHSQTPDSFFRKGYDPNGEYVDRDTMLKRMENYIRQVFE